MSLRDLGWNETYEEQIAELGSSSRESNEVAGGELTPARVVREDRGRCLVHDGEICIPAELSGSARRAAEANGDYPAVGDWVLIARPTGLAVVLIESVLPRATVIVRKEAGKARCEQVVAANVDTAMVVAGLDGEYNLSRIERYLTLVWSSGATPVVVLNKSDLCDDPGARLREVEARSPGVEVFAVSAAYAEGLSQLAPYLGTGQTVALLGSSGAGKSTLVNQLLGEERQRTGAVRGTDDRGRHTTTVRQLVNLPQGGLLIDTPGLREIQLWAQECDLDHSFADITSLAAECRFRNCAHQDEPGCAVEQAVADGRLEPARLRSFLKQQRELRKLELRGSEAGRRLLRQGERKLGRFYKQVIHGHPKRDGGR